MSFAEFELQYFQPYVYWWLLLAALLGLAIGLQIGQRIGAKRALREQQSMGGKAARAASAAATLDAIAAEAHADEVEQQPSSDEDESSSLSSNSLAALAGISKKQVARLTDHGIADLDDLRSKTASKPMREALADELQLEDFVVNKWARMAQLHSLDGMSSEWAELLVVFGVSSLGDLAERNAESVHHKLQDLNNKEKRVSSVPSRQQIEQWVAAAKS